MCVLGGIVLSSVGVAVGGDWDASRSPKNVKGKYNFIKPGSPAQPRRLTHDPDSQSTKPTCGRDIPSFIKSREWCIGIRVCHVVALCLALLLQRYRRQGETERETERGTAGGAPCVCATCNRIRRSKSPYLIFTFNGAGRIPRGKLRIELVPLNGAYSYVITCSTWSFCAPPVIVRSESDRL